MGLSILLTAPIGGRLTHWIGTTWVIRLGLLIQAAGLLWIAFMVGPDLTYLRLMPGLISYGVGVGWASAQLTNLVLSDVPDDKSGVASGTNTTLRQVGSALGIAVIGTLVTTQTVSHAVRKIHASPTLPPAVKDQTVTAIHRYSTGARVPSGVPSSIVAELRHIMTTAIGDGTHDALLFAAGVVLIGLWVSMLLPQVREPASTTSEPDDGGADHGYGEALAEEIAEDLAGFLPVDFEPELAAARAARRHAPSPSVPDQHLENP